MSKGMIELVARALCERQIRINRKWDKPAFDEGRIPAAVDYAWNDFAEQARVAIEAMRDPTDAMEYAGATVADNIANVEAEACWKAMIDAALSSAKQKAGEPR